MPLELNDVSIGLLSRDQVAEQLAFALPQLQDNLGVFVDRLIARGALKAVKFGEDRAKYGKVRPILRVRLEDLKSFLDSNGQTFEAIRQTFNMPVETMSPIFPLDDKAWFTNPWVYNVEKLASSIRDQLQAQVQALVDAAKMSAEGGYPKPISPELDRGVRTLVTQLRDRVTDTISVEVPVNPALAALVATPVDGKAAGAFLDMPNTALNSSMFLNRGEVMLATWIQSAAKQIIQAQARSNPLALTPEDVRVLYASPAEYQRIRDAAIETFLSRSALDASTRVAFALEGPHTDILVQVSISNRALMQACRSSDARLGSLAF